MKFHINLQLFTEEKTEKATPKKVKESREKGQVLQSKEVNSALVLLGAFVTLNLLAGYIGASMRGFARYIYDQYLNIDYLFSLKNISRLTLITLYHLLKISIPIGIVCLLIGVICSYAQVGYLFTTKTLAVKFSKLNPIEGFKRMFSMKSLVELIKSFIKIIFIGYIVYRYAVNQLSTIFNMMLLDVGVIVETLIHITINIGLRSAVVLLVIAVLDYYYQKYDYDKNLKMSKQEIKEEYKQTEGNPQIKSKIKEKQRQLSMGRMMQEVPKADVIITNPTHFAVAIQYNPKHFDAPKVLAKGQDLIAQNIKKIAKENSLPIIENKPLARTLYDTVEIGEFIPPELYQAVAEILAYVYQMNNRT
ncbi:flagellar biosynthesis protein FlhB [Clostridium formicaceticum]|uniref:Flagellar biosynthetic protein FlhB n=1 Tax=Clostridium formicaceticum TaxID=1497 RepID=A0AAC9RP93_9CLOT|nr:flagellar biosynthesis protein FlhB [Clostridium formicaceticum]AOY77302.1 flagellar biosynthesis protein FlhB [Clostridium formicaceticum]ARE87845.1 Flagellar biosynthetic protein FlhB [Clostridium formicaceticum]